MHSPLIGLRLPGWRLPGWKVAAALVAFATLSLGIAGTAAAQTLSFDVQTKKDTAVDVTVLEASSPYQVVGILATAAHGTATVLNARTVRYTPAAGYVGADTFTYMISNGTVSLNGVVNVTVKEGKSKPKPDSAELNADVLAACTALSSSDGALTALCNLYLGDQLPPWAKQSIGKVILKRAESLHNATVICATTSTDAALNALCALYLNPALSESMKKDVGKLVEKYVKRGASAASLKEKNKDRGFGLALSISNKGKNKSQEHD